MNFSPLEIFAIKFSLKVACLSICLTVPFSILLAHFLINTKFCGKVIIENFFNLPLVLPPVVTGYILLVLLNSNSLLGSFFESLFKTEIAFAFPGAVIAASVVSFPLVLRPIKISMQSIDPNYILVSRSLGVNAFKSFFRIILPMSIPGIIAAAVLGFARSIGEFGATIMLAGNIAFKTTTIPLEIFSSFNSAGKGANTMRLVIISIAISFVSVILSEIFLRKGKDV